MNTVQHTNCEKYLTLRLLMSDIYMELLVKSEMLTSYIYGPTFGNAETVSFYLLHNVSTLNIYEISSLRVNIIKWQVKFNPVA